jgi:hypothetical protein
MQAKSRCQHIKRVLDYFLRALPELSVKIRMIVRIHSTSIDNIARR